MGTFTRMAHSGALANPAVALGFSALSLLLLVIVLLSVPGPIKGLYWFSIEGEQSGQGKMTVGVLGWCCESACSGASKKNGADSGDSDRDCKLYLCSFV
jgi:hypothetical protein